MGSGHILPSAFKDRVGSLGGEFKVGLSSRCRTGEFPELGRDVASTIRPMRRATQTASRLAWSLLLAASSFQAAAFSPTTQAAIAEEAAALAPPDLARQLTKHKKDLRAGALAPFSDRDPKSHSQHADGVGKLGANFRQAVEAAITSIRGHRPFREVVFQLGVVSHYLADANNPLASSGDDREEARYFRDFLGYVESALPRFPLTFYGVEPGLDNGPHLDALLRTTLSRSRGYYPSVGREYRRIGFAKGSVHFDDRSTAFGISSLAFSHSVTDVAQTFRYIWLRSGGSDGRRLPKAGKGLVFLPRRAAGP